MPLRDHFRSPVDDHASWEGFHALWPGLIVHQLRKLLPTRYIAEPRAHSGSAAEVDIAGWELDDPPSPFVGPGSANGGVATAVWVPTKPTLAVPTELPDADEYAIRIFDTRKGRRLVAAIEIVSPANKDRPEHRRLFVAKCVALLQQRVSVAVIDLVTVRHFNLYADLLALLNHSDPALGEDPPPVYSVACRWRIENKGRLLETWNPPLVVGQPLPTLPLWLSPHLALPLELEESYELTCYDLRIP